MGENDTPVENVDNLEGRFRSLYDPARASQMTFDYLRDHPFCQRSELTNATGLQYSKDEYPEIVQLTKGLMTTREIVRRTYQALQSEVLPRGLTIAGVLFQAATKKDGYVHQKPLEIGYLNNPFALILSARSPDFEYLDARDVAGHYNRRLTVTANGDTFTVPFIAIKADSTISKEAILKHEVLHARNAAIADSLRGENAKHLWGTRVARGSSRIDSTTSLKKSWRGLESYPNKAEIIEYDIEWKNIIGQCLSEVKDELLVRLSLNEGLSPLFARHGIYDYLEDYFYFYGEEGLPSLLWQRYTSTLTKQTRVVHSLLNTYRFYGFEDRADMIPWMLMRVPLNEWETSLNSVGITAEADLVSKIGRHRDEDPALERIFSDKDSLHVHDLASYWQTLQKK